MTALQFYQYFLYSYIGIALFVFVLLFWIPAPYGRHQRKGWGPQVPFLFGWIVMEIPALLGMFLLYFYSPKAFSVIPFIFLALWCIHYFQRTFIYSFIRRDRSRPIPLSVVLMGFTFNIGNAYLNGFYLFYIGSDYALTWLYDPRFLLGVCLFLVGWAINIQSDTILLKLRNPGEHGYKIPKGGFYRWISCPNYFGETLEWLGWAFLTWSPGGFVFAFWTFANLAPRAKTHHHWYQEKFNDYPQKRKAIIPFLW